MAWTGTAAITMVSDRVARITGLSLANGASGTISLSGGTGDVKLPAMAKWDRYNNAVGALIELDDSVEVALIKAEAGLATTEACAAVKSGNGPTDFLITVSNPDAAASGALEIYLKYH